ncbi:MAG: hypothetical protein V4699_02205 [Patescibacteria group bacterium]
MQIEENETTHQDQEELIRSAKPHIKARLWRAWGILLGWFTFAGLGLVGYCLVKTILQGMR